MMATSHRFSCAAAQSSEAESLATSCATTSSPGRGAGASTRRTTQPSSVVECKRASRRAAVKVASPHWVGGNVLTKQNRMLIVQVPSERTENEASRSKILRPTGSVYARPATAIRLRSWLRPRGDDARCSNCRPSQAHQRCDDVSLSEDGGGR